MALSFESLFAKAISEWPDVVDLTKTWTDVTTPESYEVVGLGDLQDRISGRYRSSDEALLMFCMHWTINIALHGLARGLETVRPSTLSPAYARVRFENDVRQSVNERPWTKPQVALAKAYLAGVDAG